MYLFILKSYQIHHRRKRFDPISNFQLFCLVSIVRHNVCAPFNMLNPNEFLFIHTKYIGALQSFHVLWLLWSNFFFLHNFHLLKHQYILLRLSILLGCYRLMFIAQTFFQLHFTEIISVFAQSFFWIPFLFFESQAECFWTCSVIGFIRSLVDLTHTNISNTFW